MKHKELKKHIIIPPKPIGAMKVKAILTYNLNALQNSDHITLDNSFLIQLGVVKILRGSTWVYITNIEKVKLPLTFYCYNQEL